MFNKAKQTWQLVIIKSQLLSNFSLHWFRVQSQPVTSSRKNTLSSYTISKQNYSRKLPQNKIVCLPVTLSHIKKLVVSIHLGLPVMSNNNSAYVNNDTNAFKWKLVVVSSCVDCTPNVNFPALLWHHRQRPSTRHVYKQYVITLTSHSNFLQENHTHNNITFNHDIFQSVNTFKYAEYLYLVEWTPILPSVHILASKPIFSYYLRELKIHNTLEISSWPGIPLTNNFHTSKETLYSLFPPN
jgi:hypothetical protein